MNIAPKIIKTEAEYRACLAEVERLAIQDPLPDTPDGDRLELLAKLVEDYELERFRFRRPSPVDAIRFRMEEQGLRQKDLIPILGGKNRVSEVLSGKRPLTLPMIRALNEALKIPVDLLIYDARAPASYLDSDAAIDPPGVRDLPPMVPAHVANRLPAERLGLVYLKQTIPYGATSRTDTSNLEKWITQVRTIAKGTASERGKWVPGTLGEEFLQKIARLSGLEDGPLQAKSFLAEAGIALVVLPALPGTKLDGAAMLGEDGAPIVGLTIRHDRIDNFWFTLLHELAHAWKHLSEEVLAITDEEIESREDEFDNEVEANRIARDAFVPRSEWKRSNAFLWPSEDSIIALAEKLYIHPAIVAGRIRREKSGYRVFGHLVGQGRVRRLFPKTKWK